jgi:hypothetical protein
LGREPFVNEVHDSTHRRQGTGPYVDDRSRLTQVNLQFDIFELFLRFLYSQILFDFINFCIQDNFNKELTKYLQQLSIPVRQIYPRLSNWSFGTRQVDRGRGINIGGMDMESWPPTSSTGLFTMFLLAKESLVLQH